MIAIVIIRFVAILVELAIISISVSEVEIHYLRPIVFKVFTLRST